MTNELILNLKQLTSNGTTIVATIHQPSSRLFQYFDDLIVLSRGYLIYNGPLRQAKSFFQEELGQPCPPDYNIADHFITVVTVSNTDEAKSMAAKFKPRSTVVNSVLSSKSIVTPPAPPFWVQCPILLARSMTDYIRNKGALFTLFILQFIMVGVFGLIFIRLPRSHFDVPYDMDDVFQINGALYVMLMTYHIIYSQRKLFTFPMLKPLLRREVYDGLYSIQVAVTAIMLVDIPMLIFLGALPAIPLYFMMGLNTSLMTLAHFYFTLLLVALCATGNATMISTYAHDAQQAQQIIGIFSLPAFLMNGLFIPISRIPVYARWLHYTSWIYYGAETLMTQQWTDDISICVGDLTTERTQYSIFERHHWNCSGSCSCYEDYYNDTFHSRPGSLVTDEYQFVSRHIPRNYAALVAIALFSRLAALAIATWRYRDAKR